ncbi:MAG TPA: T9SS type A sorting domain-containing protein [Hymenobacter sp.]|uniref:T9SS type A sorting domain-containing protein n=1 Tax=Hymenobacter sp. TaxID=1898978 RepID=UPI002D809A7F|nr:T9SS type A sorting domain-containing protein [Hymenobacter sp.]HET9504432.1 T9SS type A sorting domain-containing protein [Hymenobacter sp.]
MKKTILALAGLLLASATAQAQWVLQPYSFSNSYLTPFYLDAVDANVVWSAGLDVYDGEGGDEVAHTSNGGTTWATTAISNLSADEVITGVAGLSATTALVCTVDNGVGGGRILKTVDGGTTWTVQTTTSQFATADSYPNGIAFFNATEGICFGDPATGAGKFEIYRTTDAGATWVAVPSANLPASQASEYGGINQVSMAGNSFWFATNKGRILGSVDKGLTWTVSDTNFGATVPLISFRDAQNGIALNTNTGAMLATTNGGSTWSPVSYTGPLHGFALHNVPGSNTYLSVGLDSDAGSSFSRDNGVTWTAIESTLNHVSVDVVSPTVAWSSTYNAADLSGLGVYKLTSTALGTRQNVALQQGLSVYPNPSADGQFTVAMAQGRPAEAQVTVFDALGRSVYTRTVATAAPTFTIDLGRQALGVYTMQLRTEGGVAQQKLVIK